MTTNTTQQMILQQIVSYFMKLSNSTCALTITLLCIVDFNVSWIIRLVRRVRNIQTITIGSAHLGIEQIMILIGSIFLLILAQVNQHKSFKKDYGMNNN